MGRASFSRFSRMSFRSCGRCCGPLGEPCWRVDAGSGILGVVASPDEAEVVLTLEEEDRLASLLTEVVRPGRAAKPKPVKPARPKSMRKLVGTSQPIGAG